MKSNTKPMKKETMNHPDSFETHRARYETLVQEGNWEDARPHIVRALALRPEFAPAHNQLGMCCFQEGDPGQAEACFKKAIQLDFGLIEAHFNLGALAQSVGRMQEALPHFKEVVTANPDDEETYNRMGMCSMALKSKENAEAFFFESLRLRPDFLDPLVSLTALTIEQGRLSEAKALLEEGLKIHHGIPQLHFTLGLVLKTQEQFEDALGEFREVVLRDEDNAEAFNHLGECCVALGMEEQAEPFFARAAKVDPEMSPAVFNLGKLYHDQERWNEAIVTLEEWLRQETGEIVFSENAPDEEDVRGLVYDMLGTCYAQKGDGDRAREMWEQALSLNLDQAEIVEKLEWLPQPLLSPVSLTIDN